MTCAQCGEFAAHRHHCIYVQELRRIARSTSQPWSVLVKDERNLLPLCLGCHAAHHNRSRPLHLMLLGNDVINFARQVLGAGPAYEYLIRRYQGEDHRVSALLLEWEQAA